MTKGVIKKTNTKQNIIASTIKNDLVIEDSPRTCDNKENNALGNNPLLIRLTNQNLMEAVIFSEILGKPRSKRRRCR